ncbi:alpha-L-fucosidase [Xanthomonas sacchari]|uniref:alpha-L-fucosidase n=1 Tax=Xanthomonas sacchari TaxID=56458 RepID=UPI003529160F
MKRRTLLSLSANLGVLSALPSLAAARSLARPASLGFVQQGRVAALPTADQVRWQRREMGMFVHFGNETYSNGRPHDFSVPAQEVNPVDLDTDQWAETAVAAGATYIVFVAKHQYGFCCWQTDTTDFSLKRSPWKHGKGDIMAMLRASCDRYGLGLGVYLSPRDDHFGAATGGICKTPAEQARYDAVYRQQLTELTTRYGALVEVWFDGATATPVADILQQHQPHAAVFQGAAATIRWVGNEDGFAPYPCWNGVDRAVAALGTATALDSDPDGDRWLPNEVDVSIRRPEWFWTPTNGDKVLHLDQLLSIYYRSVGRGAQLLLNVCPNPRGLVDKADQDAVAAFGAEIRRRFGKALATTSGAGADVILTLPQPRRIDTVVLQEQIEHGERVRAYVLEGRVAGAWTTLGQGSAVGYKRIQPVVPIEVDAVRVRTTRAAAAPMLRTLAVYDTGVPPPADWNAPSGLWSKHLIGDWKDGAFSFDLRGVVTEAAQYKLRLVAADGAIVAITDVTLVLGGAPQPKMLKHVPQHADELIINVTGMGDTGTISGKVSGASRGQALLQKM